MIWYKYLYLGETAKKHRFSILQKLRLGKVQPGVHVITPASGGHNLLDILPAYVLRQNYYREQADLLIVGVGATRMPWRRWGGLWMRRTARRVDLM